MKRNSRRNPLWVALSLAVICVSCSNSAGGSGSEVKTDQQTTVNPEVWATYSKMLGEYKYKNPEPYQKYYRLILTEADFKYILSSRTDVASVLPDGNSMGLGTIKDAKEWFLSKATNPDKEEKWNNNYKLLEDNWPLSTVSFALKDSKKNLLILALKKTDSGVDLLDFVPNNDYRDEASLIPITSEGASGGDGDGGSISFNFKKPWKITGETVEGRWLAIKDDGTFDMYKNNSVYELYKERTWTVNGAKLTLHYKTSSSGVDSEIKDTFAVSGTESSMEWKLTASWSKTNGSEQTSSTSSALLNAFFGKPLETQASFTAK